MRCFNHQDREAVGSCKACAKGLCGECAVDLGHGLSCQGPHEAVVSSCNAIIQYNSRVVAVASGNTYLFPAFLTAMGAVFIGFGYHRYGSVLNLPIMIGCLFVVYAAVIFVRMRAMYARSVA